MTYVIVASVALGGILLFLLAVASANTSLFATHYPLLLILNAVIAAALVGLVGYELLSLRRALRGRVFGSRLTLRLLVLFAIMAVVPGALVYTVSVQFLTKSIESWFDVRVATALESGLTLGRSALDTMLSELRGKARVMALELSDLPPVQQPLALDRLRAQAGIDEAVLLGASGAPIASASREPGRLAPDAPPAALLRQARQGLGYAAIETQGEKGFRLRVIVPVAGSAIAEETRLLQLSHTVPPSLAETAETVQSVYRDYKQLSLLRLGLKRIYLLTLTLTLLLALFSAIALAFILSRRLSEPLGELAEATLAVARGDFSRRPKVTSRDELGVLTRSFNSMIGQLDDARGAAEANRIQVESAKAYLENILANLSAGVLVFDEGFALQVANSGAAAILGEDPARRIGGDLTGSAVFDALAQAIRHGFAGVGAEGAWQRELDLGDRALTLLVRGSRLPAGGGYVVVFDDVTQLIVAQRAAAWGEVARRLAHEIKNPLTPIQLSAERLQAKLADKLGAEEREALVRATETIVSQVAAMKAMVDDFREYARMPAPTLAALDLNELVAEVLALYEHSPARIAARLQADLPPVRGDPMQLRQVIHNLLQNAEDALAGHTDPRIEVRTERSGAAIRLSVADNGGGFAESIMKHAFEPYVTTKPRGTGLGLAIVKKIIDDHHGTVSLENRAGAAGHSGAAVTVALPLAA
ncbi:MAG TPA: ATP-binding protein [Burkholderiales bacterium]|nr:ATP-binding protein [Burkholderiales bacterium]